LGPSLIADPRRIPLDPLRDLEVKFAELLIADIGWCVGHQVDCLRGLGEGDDFAQAGRAGQQHHDAVKAERNAAVWWSAILKRIEEESETLFCLFF
jgi:hypothetical protein